MKTWDDIWQFCFFSTLLAFIIFQNGNGESLVMGIMTLGFGLLTLTGIFFRIREGLQHNGKRNN